MPANVEMGSPGGPSRQQVSIGQVLEEQRVRKRVDLLTREVPELMQTHTTDLLNLAQMPTSDDEMITSVLDAMGSVGVQNMLTEMRENSPQDQLEAWNSMSAPMRSALEQAGWSKPNPEEGGLLDDIGDIASTAFRGVAKGVSTVGKFTGINAVLKGMTWLGEEATRTQRVNPIQSSRARLLEETGMTSEQIMQQTGIDTRFASREQRGGWQGRAEELMTGVTGAFVGAPIKGMFMQNDNPFTWWQAWNSIGHSGKDDYLADAQYAVFKNLEADYGGNAKDLLRYAKELQNGTSIDDLIEDEGKSGLEAEQFRLMIAKLRNEEPFKKAMSDLAASRVSFGRNVTRFFYNDPTKNLSGWNGIPSGALDAVFIVAADPTMVAGKISKSVRASKYVFESTSDLYRFRKLAQADELVNKGGSADEIAAVLQDVSGKGWRRNVPVLRQDALLAEAKAVGAPVAAINEAFRTGDFATLVRRYPGFERSVMDMKMFHANRAAQGFTGLETVDGVFDFYGYAAGNRDWMNAVDAAFHSNHASKSTALFGHNGGGALFIPKSTFSERLAMETRMKIGNWAYMRNAAPPALKAGDDAATATELVQQGGDDAAEIADSIGNPDGFAQKAADDMEVDEDTLAYTVKKTDTQRQALDDLQGGNPVRLAPVRERIRGLARGVTTPAPRAKVLGISDFSATTPEEFRRLNSSMGMLKNEPQELIDLRYNQFIQGNLGERYMLVTSMLDDFGRATGWSATKEGSEQLRKLVEHRNKIYGLQDEFGLEVNGNVLSVRAAIDESQLSDMIQAPDFREMMLASRHANFTRRVAGGIRKSELDALAVKFWKPAVVTRFGFAIRNGAEEALQFIGRVSALDYLNRAVFEKWAGIRASDGTMAVNSAGEILRAPEGAFNFGRWVTRSMASMFNVTDDAISRRALETAMQDINWPMMADDARDALVAQARDEITGGLRKIPNSVRWIDIQAHNFAANASEVWHKTALGRRVNRAEFADLILKSQGAYTARLEKTAAKIRARQGLPELPIPQSAYARRMEDARDFVTTVGAREASAEVIGHSLAGIVPDNMARRALKTTGIIGRPGNPTHYQHIPIRSISDEWVDYTHSDLQGFYAAFASRVNGMADSDIPRAAMYELGNYIDQGSVDRIDEMFGSLLQSGYADEGEILTGLDSVRALREEFLNNDIHKYREWDKETLREWLDGQAKAAADEAAAAGKEAPVLWHTTPLGEAIVDNWDNLSDDMMRVLTNVHLAPWKLSSDVNEIINAATRAAHKAAFTFKNAKTQYSMIRGMVVDGKPLAEVVPEGHLRIYGPMIDRNAIEDLLNILQVNTPNSTTKQFMDRLQANLNAQGLGDQVSDAWAAAWPKTDGPVPEEAITTWLSGLKASIAQSGDPYIPALMTGSANPNLAFALRDTLRDVLPEQTLAPTVGYFDIPEYLLTDKTFGLEQINDAVVRMQPHHALRQRVINPESTVRQFKVELDNGEVRWLGQSELDQLNGSARLRGDVDVQLGRRGKMVSTKGRQVVANDRLIRADFENNRAFFAGNGGEYQRTVTTYAWDDDTLGYDALMMDELFDELGVYDNYGFDSVEEVIRVMRTRRHNLPLEQQGLRDLLRDNPWPVKSQTTVTVPTGRQRVLVVDPKGKRKFEWVVTEKEELVDDKPRTIYQKLQELSRAATKDVKREGEKIVDQFLVDQSKIVRRALDELGVSQDTIQGLTFKQYRKLMLERERAHVLLQAPGARRARSASATAVQQEMDALALAFQRTGISPGAEAADAVRNRLRVAAKEEKAAYKILGEAYGSGITQDAAMLKLTQQVTDEVTHMLLSKETGEPLVHLIDSALRGDLTAVEANRLANIKELPEKTFGPAKMLPTESKYQRMINNIHEGSIQPMIASISRMPMMMDAFGKSKQTFRHVYTNIAQEGLNAEARAVLAGREGWLGSFNLTDSWDDVNRYVVNEFKDNPEWFAAGDDLMAELAHAVHIAPLDSPAVAEEIVNGVITKHLDIEIPDGGSATALLGDKAFKAEEIDMLRRWQLNQSNAYETWFEVSHRRALEMVTPFIDDHRIRSAMSEYISPLLIPFFSAEQQFLKRFARGIYETPQLLRKGQLMMNGLRSIGVIQKDANDKEIFVVPFSQLAGQAVAFVAEPVFGQAAMEVFSQPLAMRTDMMLPGFNTTTSRFGAGPLLGLATNEITTRFPETEWRTDDPNRSRVDYLLPATVTQPFRLFAQDKNELMSAELSAIQMLYASGITEDRPEGYGLKADATASEKDEFLANVRQVARAIGVLKIVSGFVVGSKAAPVDASSYLRKEFTDLLAEGLSYEDALQVFIEKNGPGGLAYTMYGTNNEVGAPIPNGAKAFDFMTEYGDMIRDDPETMVWLIPQADSKDEFDRRAYNEAMSLGLRSRREPQELIDAFEIKQASGTYYEKRDVYEANRRAVVDAKGPGWKEERDRLDAEWGAWKDSYLKMHPTFGESFSGDASERRKRVIEKLQYRTKAGFGGEQGEMLSGLLDAYVAFKRDYDSISGQSAAAGALKKDLFDKAFTGMWVYVKKNPRLAVFFNSVIRPELPDAMMDSDLAGLGGLSARDVMEV